MTFWFRKDYIIATAGKSHTDVELDHGPQGLRRPGKTCLLVLGSSFLCVVTTDSVCPVTGCGGFRKHE